MPNRSQNPSGDLDRVSAKEINNQKGGREASGTPTKLGPAVGHVSNPNSTKSGGINRPTQGSGSGESKSKQN